MAYFELEAANEGVVMNKRSNYITDIDKNPIVTYYLGRENINNKKTFYFWVTESATGPTKVVVFKPQPSDEDAMRVLNNVDEVNTYMSSIKALGITELDNLVIELKKEANELLHPTLEGPGMRAGRRSRIRKSRRFRKRARKSSRARKSRRARK